jgi:hypothetical protein
MVLDAAGPTQCSAIKSVLLLICRPDAAKGTGFLLKNGLEITAAHVVGTCNAGQIEGTKSMGRSIRFSKLAKDAAKAGRPPSVFKGDTGAESRYRKTSSITTVASPSS